MAIYFTESNISKITILIENYSDGTYTCSYENLIGESPQSKLLFIDVQC